MMDDPVSMEPEDDSVSIKAPDGMPSPEDELGSCVCCDGPVDSELVTLSDLVLESEERPVLEVLQELLACADIPPSSRLCRHCLARVLRYHQLCEALRQLERQMRSTFLEVTAARGLRSSKTPAESSPMILLDAPSSPPSALPSPPLPSPPAPSCPPISTSPPPPLSSSRDDRSPEREEKPDLAGGDVVYAETVVSESVKEDPAGAELNISIQVLQPPPPPVESAQPVVRPTGTRPPLPCLEPGCGRSFPSRSVLEEHVHRWHGPPGPRCPECTLVFDTEQEMEKHVAAVHKAGAAQYSCGECDEHFHLESELKQHQRSEHEKQRIIRCRHCRKTFRSRNAYLEHQTKHNGQNMIDCPVCSEKFRTRACLNQHRLVHRKHGRVHSCDQCDGKFATVGRLRTHEMREHGVEQPWRCEAEGCTKSFKSSAALEVHSVQHTGERPFSCQQCGKRFVTKHRLKAHFRIHTGERPYQCAQCGRQFRYKSNLLQHNIAHQQTERNHRCPDCGRTFRKPGQLETHRSSCQSNSDAPPAAPATTASTRRTPLTKQYKCSICYRAFLRLDNLRTHMFIHSEKKPFECRVCGLGFVRRSQLRAHMQALGHGEGVSDYIINEAVFVMNEAQEASEQRSVRLISARPTQMVNVVQPNGSQLATTDPNLTRIFVKTITPNTVTGRPVGLVRDDQQILFKTASPQSEDVDSPRAVTTEQIVFRDSPQRYLDSPRIVQLDDEQIIFKPESPRVELGASESCSQDS
ncbi:zinc finger protein 135-like [Amphibalanus amphitrite]|uniref:zinc finger protein 135-like n=1 Tax=Amphibalanus amphitrite TaxID=1232801 RepID=UPI001C91705D|nr:zinc finger protein 135-like [Amphibalanus amphitrite]XP_043195132.1 zinc finger protein 135-like [Amphibalanus amphitrite]